MLLFRYGGSSQATNLNQNEWMKHKFICMCELTASLKWLGNFFFLGPREQVFFMSENEVQNGTRVGERKGQNYKNGKN